MYTAWYIEGCTCRHREKEPGRKPVIAERDADIKAKDSVIAERDADIKAKDSVIAKLQAELERLKRTSDTI
mgnify:CR=1 FL=1